MTWDDDPRPTPAERRADGRARRQAVPRSSHGEWAPAADRPDPVDLLEEQNEQRLPWLAPVRRGRMVASPFTFYRGAARVMAADLAATADSGLRVQACGDAHLSNFGAYASPERQLVFDVNDFDETLPGPWEWDLKRLAASFTIAAQASGFPGKVQRSVTAGAVASYRTAMAEMADERYLDVWYDHLAVDDLAEVPGVVDSKAGRKRVSQFVAQARSKDSLQALRKLAVEVDGRWRIRSQPPVLVPLDDVPDERSPDALRQVVEEALVAYRDSLADHRRHLLDRYRPVDVALKVVGVGSVGTRCLIVLLEGRDHQDPLFLQVKEATRSVLEEHLPKSRYRNSGRRVVAGQRLTQAASDVFLGWTRSNVGRDFYVRQLRDWKGSVAVEAMAPDQLHAYARVCGWTLARGHARSGDPCAIAGYVGSGVALDAAMAAFGQAYAAQNAEDHAAFAQAIADGRLEADREG